MDDLKAKKLQKRIEDNKLPICTNYSYPFDNFINDLENGMMGLPPIQRLYVWDKKRASEFVVSAFENIPLSSVIVYGDQESSHCDLLIDGQQRILSLYMFVKGKWLNENGLKELRCAMELSLKTKHIDERKVSLEKLFDNTDNYEEFCLDLSDIEDDHYLHGVKFSDLTHTTQRSFLTGTRLPTFVFKSTGDEGIKLIRRIFKLVNTGGVPIPKEQVELLLKNNINLLFK